MTPLLRFVSVPPMDGHNPVPDRSQDPQRRSHGRARIPGSGVLERGFTVVELITVIVLLSILGVFAMSRLMSPAAFAPAIVTHAFIAELRQAQQLAAARHDAVISLTLVQVGDDWRVRTLSDVDGVVRESLIDVARTSVVAASGAVSDDIDSAAALTLTYNHAGDLEDVVIDSTPGVPAAGVALTVTGETVRQICIYPSGYAHDGACV